jgi:anti-sigma regulatory factor (Ser/Thr protein kinase)
MGAGFQMSIGTEPGGVARVVAAFAEFAEAQALAEGVRRSLQVALDELLKNTISYGFRGRREGEGELTVAVALGSGRLTVTVTDDGVPFDPFAAVAPDTTLGLELRRIGGLGIHLVRKMMDEVSYEYRGDRNVVVLTKFLAEGEGD